MTRIRDNFYFIGQYLVGHSHARPFGSPSEPTQARVNSGEAAT